MTSNCIGPTAASIVAQNLHHALGIELIDSLTELLVLAQALGAQSAEVLGRELRHRLELNLAALVDRVTRCQ